MGRSEPKNATHKILALLKFQIFANKRFKTTLNAAFQLVNHPSWPPFFEAIEL